MYMSVEFNDGYRDLTREEIENLSLDLRICFYMHEWNNSFHPKNFQEWAERFNPYYTVGRWNLLYNQGFMTTEELKNKRIDLARDEFKKLYNLIMDCIK
jgi:hypothetical protein